MIQPRYEGGSIYLPELGLWLDAHSRRLGPERVFVSHAHSDHIGSHEEVILTAPTAELMHHRLKGKRREHILEFGVRTSFCHQQVEYAVTLLPAGHILGSAMILIEHAGSSLLYTGDFKLRPGESAEACAVCPAEVVIMESTFGRPEYVFPEREKIAADILAFCSRALEEGKTPVLLAYSLGKSQEVLKVLTRQKELILLHEETFKCTRICEHHGMAFPPYAKFKDHPGARGIVIWPPHRQSEVHSLAGRPVAMAIVSGWAMDPRSKYRFKVDAGFPLSDHADYPELLEFVRRVGPKKIYTLHGFSSSLAQSLRALNYDAQALDCHDQLELNLGR